MIFYSICQKNAILAVFYSVVNKLFFVMCTLASPNANWFGLRIPRRNYAKDSYTTATLSYSYTVWSSCFIYDKTVSKILLSRLPCMQCLMLWSLCVHAVCLSYKLNIKWNKIKRKKDIVDVFILCNSLACVERNV